MVAEWSVHVLMDVYCVTRAGVCVGYPNRKLSLVPFNCCYGGSAFFFKPSIQIRMGTFYMFLMNCFRHCNDGMFGDLE